MRGCPRRSGNGGRRLGSGPRNGDPAARPWACTQSGSLSLRASRLPGGAANLERPEAERRETPTEMDAPVYLDATVRDGPEPLDGEDL